MSSKRHANRHLGRTASTSQRNPAGQRSRKDRASSDDEPDAGESNACQPFLKWAGGKRWLLHHARTVFPSTFATYIEPFAGSAAVFFALGPANAILNDINRDLIETYKSIRDNWRAVLAYLIIHQARHSTDYYYAVRDSVPRGRHERAARFIYLNRTCWNGLYRVNRNGVFNVPIGTKDQVLLPTDDFEHVAQRLDGATLLNEDFEKVVDTAGDSDLVYADPPYTINHEKNGFLKYNQHLFSWEDQKRLRASLDRARSRGAFVIVSNAGHQTLADLYGCDFTRRTLWRYSRISGLNCGRTRGREYIFTGGPT